ASWGLPISYFAWFTFLLLGAALYAWLARDPYFFQLRRQGFDTEASRKIAADKGQQLFPNQRVWQAVITAAEDPRTWGLVALYFVSFGGFLALTAWFPTYWINLHHLDLKTAAALGGIGFSLLAAVVRVFGGMISERAGGERTALLAFIVVLIGALTLSFVTDFKLALTGELLIAVGMGVANAAVFKMVPKFVPDAVGGASGIVGGLGALGGFIIPPFLGAVVDAMGAQGYAGGFFAYVLLAVMAIGVSAYFQHLDRGTKSTPVGPALVAAR
ncbi:MAG TPA: MFS transporter, partial [Xanthobacteraceae bacterium]|nr:MFS transporter [Xanthobacteraceae bacterium]